MDAGRGFLGASGATGASTGAGVTRTRPVSAHTGMAGLRQKPAAARDHQDFFASLGIDAQSSRSRAGSGASSSSNRSFNNITVRGSGAPPPPPPPQFPAGMSLGGATATKTPSPGASSGLTAPPTRPPPAFGGWRTGASPPGGGATAFAAGGSQRSPPAPAASTLQSSMTRPSTMNFGSGSSASSTAATATTATATTATATSDVMVSGGSSVGASAGATSQPKPKATQLFSMDDSEDLFSDDGWGCDSPSAVLSDPMEEAERAASAKDLAKDEEPKDDFAWGDDDDAFASPPATPSAPVAPPPPPQVRFDAPSATKSEPFVGGEPAPTSFSASSTAVETESFDARPPPPPPMESPPSDSPADHAWIGHWDQQSSSTSGAGVTETKATASTAVTTTATPAVELTSPAGAAGEFWGDEDDDALFDHDDHEDEEWDESIKEHGETLDTRALHEAESESMGAETFPSQESSSFSPPPPPPQVKETPAREELPALPAESSSSLAHESTAAHTEGYQASGPMEALNRSFGHADESSQSANSLFYADAGGGQDEGASSRVATGTGSFANTLSVPPAEERDASAFPESAPTVRFVPTPTGAEEEASFGHASFSQGQEDISAADGLSTSASAQETTQTSTAAVSEIEEALNESTDSDFYGESSAKWDVGLTPSSDQARSDAVSERHADETGHHAERHAQSDEEERDSVVSFSDSAGVSLFPSGSTHGRPSSLYGGSQSSFASRRMYASSTASTDHDGSSIASFGVSSAGATFGGSERVSEGPFSDGTASETPSMVDSSNASTAFGTDFPSVSEGQFSAPGTTIGGSDNASDGGFSDGNGSETTSMCESVNTNSALVSEFRATSGHYVTQSVERSDTHEPFTSSTMASSSNTTFSTSAPPPASSMFGGDDTSVDTNPFADSTSAFPSRSEDRAPSSPPTPAAADRNFSHSENSEDAEYVPSADSLFGATPGSDVPNPFSSFGAPPPSAAPVAAPSHPATEHELPTSDAGDLFGSTGPASSGFGGNSFDQPPQPAYNSSYQSNDQQNYGRNGQQSYADTQASPFGSTASQFGASSPFDQPAGKPSGSNAFGDQGHTSGYSTSDPFQAQASAQNAFGSAASSADSVFGGNRGNADQSASSYFGHSEQTSAGAAFGGQTQHDYLDGASGAQDHFNRQSAASGFGTAPSAQSASNSYARHGQNEYGQSAGATTRTPDHYSHQSAQSAFANSPAQNTSADAFGGKNYNQYGSSGSATGSSQVDHAARSGAGTPDHFSRHSAASAFSSGPAQPMDNAFSGPSGHSSHQHFGQPPTPGTPDHYNQQPAANAFSSGSPAQAGHGGQQSYDGLNQYGHGDTGASSSGFGGHRASAAGSSANDVFGHSSTANDAVLPPPPPAPIASANDFFGRSTASTEGTVPFGGESGFQTSGNSFGHPVHAQPSFSRGTSNASSYSEQHASPRRPADAVSNKSSLGAPPSRDLNTSYGSIEDHGYSRQASSSSMDRYSRDQTAPSQQVPQQQYGQNEFGSAPTDPSAFFGQAPPAQESGVSSFFGQSPSQDSAFSMSEPQNPRFQDPPAASTAAPSTMTQLPSSSSLHSMSGVSHHEFEAKSPTPVIEASAERATPSPTRESKAHAGLDTSHEHQQYGDFNGSASMTNEFDAPPLADATQESGNDAPAFGGFIDSTASFGQDAGGHPSSDFFSSGPEQQAQSHEFVHGKFGNATQQQQQHVRDAASTSLQYAESHSGYQQPGNEQFGAGNAQTTGASLAPTNSYYQLGVHSAATPASPAGYQQHGQQRNQQMYGHGQQQYGQQQHDHQQYGQAHQEIDGYQQHQHQQPYQYQSEAATAQPQAMGYNATTGYEVSGVGQSTHAQVPAAVKTSNKYKDPCVAPPSCLASFGFGGNVVTMFPKRKLRLNFASPRGAPAPSTFDSDIDGELRKGPVSVYRMDQLHPKNKEFEQMDVFPGPLAENVGEDSVLEYLDERLKRSENPTSADEVEEENERLLLGVLRVLVKCDGKLRSDPGSANPADAESPEAQLAALLAESERRRHGNQSPTFPPPRKLQGAVHPDLAAKNASQIREMLMVGDRKAAVNASMTAQMWPEAMLIASFTDKEEYKRVLRTYLDEHYAMGDPCRALFMSFADQHEKSVQEPQKLMQSGHAPQATASPILSTWSSHAQVLLANRTADTNKILTELGDRLWKEADAVAAAHVCYLLAGGAVEAPSPTSKMALLGGDHRTPREARFYVSPAAVQRTEIYEWVLKRGSAKLMIPFQGYKLIYAMLLADHGKLETAFKYVASMLAVIKGVMATMKPGSSMYLEGMKNQLTVLDDRLRQHLGQARVAQVAASSGRGRKQSAKWGLGSALSIMGKIVNRVVEGTDASSATPTGASASGDSGSSLYPTVPQADDPMATASYPSAPSASVASPTPSYPLPYVPQTPPGSASSHHVSSPAPKGPPGHPTPPASQGSAPGSSSGIVRGPGPYARPGAASVAPPSGPFSGNGRPSNQLPPSGPVSNSGPSSRGHSAASLMRTQKAMEPPGSNHSNHSTRSNHSTQSSGYTGGMDHRSMASMASMPQSPVHNGQLQSHQHSQQCASQSSVHTPASPASHQKAPRPSLASEHKDASRAGPGAATEAAATLPPVAPTLASGPASDKGRASPKMKTSKKVAKAKTPPPSHKSSAGWFSGLSSFLATKMNPDAKVAKLGEHMEAYFDEENKRWVFPGEAEAEPPAPLGAPPTGAMPASAPGSSASGPPPSGASSAPGSVSGAAASDDPLAALMAPPPSRLHQAGLMKKDPLAAMMAPPSRPGVYGARRGGATAQRRPPRPQFAVFKPSATPSATPADEASE